MPGETPEVYYRCVVFVPFIDDLYWTSSAHARPPIFIDKCFGPLWYRTIRTNGLLLMFRKNKSNLHQSVIG